MDEGFRLWANPSSPHAEGRKARSLLEDARERIKAALEWDGEVIFTSGASEAAQVAFDGSQSTEGAFISTIEHSAIDLAAFENRKVPVLADGSINLFLLNKALIDDELTPNALEVGVLDVAIQHINSETGNRQNIKDIRTTIVADEDRLIVDCAQSAGKYPIPSEADMAIISAHKLGGPIGVGALLVRDFAQLDPSGGQERGYRRGTENMPCVLGMAAALEACTDPYVAPEVLEPLDALADECRKLGGTWLSDRLSDPTPYIRAIAMPNMSATAQVMRFDMAGIAVSQGSACSSGTMKTSRVLEAMQVEPEVAANTIRVSLGWNTTRAEVERFCEVWLEMAKA
ncbi:cysteine desulfurase family protein [Qipengyuania profundimaris]